MFLVVDNYDSFTYNLVHFLGELGAELVVRRNDRITVGDVMAMDPEGIILSPGPCTPDDAGICLDLIGAASPAIPMLGVCLGHQSIGQAIGGRVVRAAVPMHGKLSDIRHNGRGLFRGLPPRFRVTRYHSLIVARDGLPDALEVTAETDDGIIMGLSHRTRPLHGLQFHPESIASQNGHALLKNFLDLAAEWNARHRPARAVA
ncbi:MAG: aminodeoxychorismate/anthranilate synthase component II [Bauldia sp.]|nr:aminodeoxychorismate/anthranilate synthase component II [Bauldia sp.]